MKTKDRSKGKDKAMVLSYQEQYIAEATVKKGEVGLDVQTVKINMQLIHHTSLQSKLPKLPLFWL